MARPNYSGVHVGLTTYILIYLTIGYTINLIGAAFAPAKEAELKPLAILTITLGWGVIAIVIAWKLACWPVRLIARVRQRLSGEVSRANG